MTEGGAARARSLGHLRPGMTEGGGGEQDGGAACAHLVAFGLDEKAAALPVERLRGLAG